MHQDQRGSGVVIGDASSPADATEDDWRSQVKVLPCGHEVLNKEQVHYCGYIALSFLEALAQPYAGTSREREVVHPDEMQFVRLHQVTEMMLAQVLYDLTRAIAEMRKDDLLEACHVLHRMSAWLHLVRPTISTFSTMRPADFNRFRFELQPASGAESLGTRRFEVRAGVELDAPYCVHRGRTYGYREFLDRGPEPGEGTPKTRWWTQELSDLATQPTLRSEFEAALARHGETLESIHAQDKRETSLRQLADALHALDHAYSEYRLRHLGVAAPQIGKAPGTGHTEGVPFLRSTLEFHLFNDLWKFRAAGEGLVATEKWKFE